MKHPKLILILTGAVSFGAGYLTASAARGPQPQFVVPAPMTMEEQKRLMSPAMRRVLGLDGSPYPTPNTTPKTYLTGE
jgi:hypothetical protein